MSDPRPIPPDVPPETAASGRSARPAWLRHSWTLARWVLFALVLVFVGRQGIDLWQRGGEGSLENIRPNVGWLALAALVYWASWLPAPWFWRKLMQGVGCHGEWPDVLRAYYCGHLGKYVPGKATVLIIRAALMKDRGARARAAALTAAVESVATVAIGAAVALALAPAVLSRSHWTHLPEVLQVVQGWPVAMPVATVLIWLAVLPLGARLLTRAALRLVPREVLEQGINVGFSTRLAYGGAVGLAMLWCLQGLAFGLVLRSMSPAAFDITHWPLWTTALALGNCIGFVFVFAPAGLGVREGVVFAIMSQDPLVGGQLAVAAALLYRLISLITELIAAGTLYYGVRPPHLRSARGETVA